MALAIYKRGQGYWTRMLSAIGAGTLVVAGIAWIWSQMQVIPDSEHRLYWQGGMVVGMVVFWGVFLYWILNKARVADFMIATEAEMKKVNWPTKKEIFGSTIVVIAGTFLIAALLFLINLVFGAIFQAIGILEASGS